MHLFGRGAQLGLFALLIAAVGCGDSGTQLAEVDGTVRMNGKPMAGLLVYFNPEVEEKGLKSPGRSSYAITDDEGRYSLTYDDPEKPRPGAVLGKHIVVISDPRLEDRSIKAKARIPMKYSRLIETPERKEVQPGKQTLDIELK